MKDLKEEVVWLDVSPIGEVRYGTDEGIRI